MAASPMDKFYSQLQTVPRLISDLALAVAEAQRRLDQSYLEDLAEFMRLIATMPPSNPPGASADQMMALFRSMAPSRYQFTETVVEVRADLQMGSVEDTKVSGEASAKGGVFAVAVNASYARRNAYDAKASALIRTVLNAVPADPGVLDKLLPRAGEVQHATLPNSDRYKALADAFNTVQGLAPQLPAGSAPAGSAPAGSPAAGSAPAASAPAGSPAEPPA